MSDCTRTANDRMAESRARYDAPNANRGRVMTATITVTVEGSRVVLATPGSTLYLDIVEAGYLADSILRAEDHINKRQRFCDYATCALPAVVAVAIPRWGEPDDTAYHCAEHPIGIRPIESFEHTIEAATA